MAIDRRSILERVQRGAAMLDNIYGGRAVWARAIDPDRLRMADGQACVLGQLLGDYGSAVDRVFGLGGFVIAESHGFDAAASVPNYCANDNGAMELATLTQEWGHVLRLAAVAGPDQWEIISTWTADPDRIAGVEAREYFHANVLRRMAGYRDADPDRTHVYSVRLVGNPTPDVLYNPRNGG